MADIKGQGTIDPRWAWQRYQPSDRAPWDSKRVGHLYRRAAFGASRAELDEGLRAGPERTIDLLLQGRPGTDTFVAATAEQVPSIGNAPANDLGGAGGELSTAWWLYRMLYSPHPTREKLTLFWHNHFATSNRKVNNAGYMLGQYELMRRHAQGNFRTLLQEMSRDPAMMVWLDTVTSPRTGPNENYARELMELFSLGINNYRRPDTRNYTEQDIRQAARAFTGWRLEDGRAVFRQDLHDPDDKTVLGQTGRWRGDDIVRICLEQESAAYFIAAKLFRFLISDTVPATPELLEPVAGRFRESNYNFGDMVETMLRSNLFFAPAVYRSKVKSPVEFALGILHGLSTPGVDRRARLLPLVRALEGLGQRPFYPPSVAGWEGGRAWLNAQTLLFRQNLALALTSTLDDRFGDRCDPARLVGEGQSDADTVEMFLRVFLQGDVPAASRERLLDYARQAHNSPMRIYETPAMAAQQRVRRLCHLVLCLPEFQLA